jgi:hypothetical protein
MTTTWFGPAGWVSGHELQIFFPRSGQDGTIFNTQVPGGTPASPPTSQEVQAVIALPLPGGTRVRGLTFVYRISDLPRPGVPPTTFTRITGVELVEHIPGVAPATRFLDPTLLFGSGRKTYASAIPSFVTQGALVLDVRLVYRDTLDVVELYEVGLACTLPCTCPDRKPPVVKPRKKGKKATR